MITVIHLFDLLNNCLYLNNNVFHSKFNFAYNFHDIQVDILFLNSWFKKKESYQYVFVKCTNYTFSMIYNTNLQKGLITYMYATSLL